MWIIPKTLSAFVPDTEGLNLELEEQAWMCEQSLMWRSKHSAAPTWQRRLKKGGWITHLSGRILKPSLHESFVEKYTDSLEDIHANHSVQQASDKEKKTQDTYGHTSSSTSGQLDLFGAFGKMSQDTPRWGYGESCPIWKKKVIDARGVYSQRKKLARHTKGNESSSWATPQASDPGSRKPGTGGKILAEEAKIHNGLQDQEKSNTSGKNQGSWATPRSRDAGEWCMNKARVGTKKEDTLTGQATKRKTLGKLNPSWVESLMGLSTGWTDLGSWGMELSPKQQN